MNWKKFKRIGSVMLSTAVIAATIIPSSIAASAASFDYSLALKDTIIFYDANKCGKDVAVNNFFSWRGACHTTDGKDVGLDLTGGYHDAGDHVKFGLPQGYAASVLGWSIYEFKDVFDSTGNTTKMLQQLKYFTDYFMKCHPNANTFYYQFGDGNTDHAYWGAPEAQPGDRPTLYKADASTPASDVLGETTAALALMYLNYKSVDATYANNCLKAAKELYAMGKANQGVGNGQSFYQATSYGDDMAWGATWLYTATGDSSYLADAEVFITKTNTRGEDKFNDRWTMSWDDMYVPAEMRLSQLTNTQKYKDAVLYNFNYFKNELKKTPGGLAYLDVWGACRYAAAEAMMMLVYSKQTGDTTYNSFAKSQVDYILGNNPANMSYVIGFGSKWCIHPHHRAANGYTYANGDNQKEAKNLLLGAMVGGPQSNDVFVDSGTEYQYTEVALDYNAGIVGAIAGVIKLNNPTNNSTISPTAANFDKTAQKDVNVTMTLNGNTFNGIKNGSTTLVSGTDYKVSGTTVTILSAYLAKQPIGTTDLIFDFSAGTDPDILITVSGTQGLKGDLNNDNACDAIDLALMKQYLLRITVDINLKNADMNDDDRIDAIDYALMKGFLLTRGK